jgi:hypothetical protein
LATLNTSRFALDQPQQYPGRSGRFAAPLLPVAQGLHRVAYGLGEGFLGEPDAPRIEANGPASMVPAGEWFDAGTSWSSLHVSILTARPSSAANHRPLCLRRERDFSGIFTNGFFNGICVVDARSAAKLGAPRRMSRMTRPRRVRRAFAGRVLTDAHGYSARP